MEQRKLELISPQVSEALDRLLDGQRGAISEQISSLAPAQQLEFIQRLADEMISVRRKIEGEFVPDRVKRVFDIIINYRSRWQIKSRYALIKFLIHIRDAKSESGDLTPENVISFLDAQGEDFHFDGAGERFMDRVRYSCKSDISNRTNK